MKTFNTIIQTIIFSLIFNLSFASGFETFKMKMNNGQTIEIFQKTEECLQEKIPGHDQTIRTFLQKKSTIAALPSYTEKTLNEEDFAGATMVKEERASFQISDEEKEFMATLAVLIKPEKELNESDLNTSKIYHKMMNEKVNDSLSAEKLQQFIKPEKELSEELNYKTLCAQELTK